MISVVPKVMGDGNTTVGVFLLIFIIEENAKFQLEADENKDVFFSSPNSLIFWITSTYLKLRIPVLVV